MARFNKVYPLEEAEVLRCGQDRQWHAPPRKRYGRNRDKDWRWFYWLKHNLARKKWILR